MIKFIFSWLLKGPLNRILDSVDHKVDNETERQKIKSDLVKQYVNKRTDLLIYRTWWLQLFFVIPLGFWWASVNIYSVLWCQDCIFNQEWTIASLPYPLNEWAWAIISSIFLLEGIKFYKRK